MEYIQIGKVINTHGVKGELKVEIFTDFIEERFKKDSFIYIGDKYEKVGVKSFRMHHEFLLLTLNDFDNINDVLKFKNKVIYKSSDDIKPLNDGYYFRDLKGLDVYVDDIKVGKVLWAETGISSNYLRIKKKDKEILVPINNVFIKAVDLNSKRIDIVKMDGLL